MINDKNPHRSVASSFLTDDVDAEAALGPVPGQIRDGEVDLGRSQLELHGAVAAADHGNAHQGRPEPGII